jgi:hypothetical protein
VEECGERVAKGQPIVESIVQPISYPPTRSKGRNSKKINSEQNLLVQIACQILSQFDNYEDKK